MSRWKFLQDMIRGTSKLVSPPRNYPEMNIHLSDNKIAEPMDLGHLCVNFSGVDLGEVEAKHRMILVQWLNSLLPSLNLPINVKDADLRACFSNGVVLCQLLNKLRPGSVNIVSESDSSSHSHSENVKRFLAALDGLVWSKFEISDLEKGNMKPIVNCLLTLRAKSLQNAWGENNSKSMRTPASASSIVHFSPSVVGERRGSDTKSRSVLSPSVADPSLVHKFQDVFQIKNGSYADIPAAKVTELMKSTSLDHLLLQNAPTQSLLSVVNGILEESVEKRNGEIPLRVACLLRKVVQEIERRISTQAEHLRTQNNLFRTREEKYHSRIKVLEALASGTGEQNGNVVASQPHQLKTGKVEKTEREEKKVDDKEVLKLTKELDDKNMEISTLKQELETTKKAYEVQCSKLEGEARENSTLKQELATTKQAYEVKSDGEAKEIPILKQELETTKQAFEVQRLDLEAKAMEISTLKQELETTKKTYEEQFSHLGAEAMEISTLRQELEKTKKTYEEQCSKLEAEAKSAKGELEQKSQEYERLLENLRNKMKENEAFTQSKLLKWNMQEKQLQKAMSFQFSTLQKLKFSWDSIKQDVVKEQKIYAEECNRLGVNLKTLVNAAENYNAVLSENRKLFNEVQELKGNIRVFCRVRPFLPGQKEKQSIVEHLGETELVVANPSKQGKEGVKSFKFNKVFGPSSTQAEVYADIQAFIRSVLDGFNVCIFAYGQTGSGKTYTMSGPNGATSESVGVNYRALNDLFSISSSRKTSIVYEIGVQIVEIYNEQVRDLLAADGGGPKKLGILSHSQPNGLAVPDASMYPVNSTSDVIKLMDLGLKNRAKSSTAMNERSSRSHSVVSIHVRGADQKSGSTLQGNLHLIDLAGSERIDRSEVTGDRLKEAQHINKSLSSLGDVIFALAQKSSHVPYRNSKLTQLLQSSLGGRAKTLMFVQINSDVKSYSESVSTLKFAERVSGVELGAAKSTKDGRDVRDLMEQVASLKNTILTKDEEIERLQLLKDLKNFSPRITSEKDETSTDGGN